MLIVCVKIFKHQCCIFSQRSRGVPWFFILSKVSSKIRRVWHLILAYRSSEKLLRPQRNPLRWEVRQPWICSRHQQRSMHSWRLSTTLWSLCHEEGKEDKLDELCLEIQHQRLVCRMACFVSQRFVTSSKTPTSSVKFLRASNPSQKPLGL